MTGISLDDGILGSGFSVNLKGDILSLWMVISRKLMHLFHSGCIVKVRVVDILLNCSSTLCMSVLLVS